jgi:hypothetical protein
METHEIDCIPNWPGKKQNPISKIIRAKMDEDVALVAELPA